MTKTHRSFCFGTRKRIKCNPLPPRRVTVIADSLVELWIERDGSRHQLIQWTVTINGAILAKGTRMIEAFMSDEHQGLEICKQWTIAKQAAASFSPRSEYDNLALYEKESSILKALTAKA